MKLQRLAGYGPTAAYVSAGALFVFFSILIFGTPVAQNAPGIAVPMTVVYIFALWVWLAALAVVVLDLEWLEHPATNTRLFQVAHWTALVSVFLPLVLVISFLAGVGGLVQVSFYLTFLLVGVNLLIHNIDARRAGLLQGIPPWLGIVTGIAFVVAGLGIWTIVPLGFIGLILGQTFYIAWAVWMGVILSAAPRKGAAPAPASAIP
jgi:hypothetical protein